jgi:hypothetical protein
MDGGSTAGAETEGTAAGEAEGTAVDGKGMAGLAAVWLAGARLSDGGQRWRCRALQQASNQARYWAGWSRSARVWPA